MARKKAQQLASGHARAAPDGHGQYVPHGLTSFLGVGKKKRPALLRVAGRRETPSGMGENQSSGSSSAHDPSAALRLEARLQRLFRLVFVSVREMFSITEDPFPDC
jgi:hypothetical protein